MMNPFLFAAGVDRQIISQCSIGEQNRYKILGSLVYVPLMTASVAMWFASGYFTDRIFFRIIACVLWALVMFVIERSLIASLQPGTFNLSVAMRIIMAVSMTLIINEFLLIACFRQDISNHILESQSAVYEQIESDGQKRIDELRSQILAMKEKYDAKEAEYLGEVAGEIGTGRYGKGPAALAKERAKELEYQEYLRGKERLEAEIEACRVKSTEALEAAEDRSAIGLLGYIEGLHDLASEDRTVKLILVIMHVFFLAVELMALTIKLNFKGTEYYDVDSLLAEEHLKSLRMTEEQRGELLTLSTEHALKQQALDTKSKITSLDYKEIKDRALAKVMNKYETLLRLEEMSMKASKTLSPQNADAFNKELELMFREYLEECKALQTT